MSKRKEKISAFLDGDMHRDELMSFSLSAESDDAEVAQRYQMVGDALRGELSDSSFVDISQAVREAVAGEETYLETAQAASAETVSLEKQGKAGLFDFSSWFKPVAGMAVAATVAVVMVTTLSQQDGVSSTGSPVAVNTSPVQPVTTVAVSNSNGESETDAQRSEQINPYINQHLEYATQDALQGRLPYVRAVSYDVQK